jgi:hypothetical protein
MFTAKTDAMQSERRSDCDATGDAMKCIAGIQKFLSYIEVRRKLNTLNVELCIALCE